MTVLLLANPRSGRGLANTTRERYRAALANAGIRAEPIGLDAAGDPGIGPGLPSPRAVVVFGGDGTVRHAAEWASSAAVPLFHVPLGNENLFARGFGMTRNPEQLILALRRYRVRRIDIGRINGTAFVIMASCGIDAAVIRRVERSRRRAVGHLAYIGPISAEIVDPSIPTVTLIADGIRRINVRRGTLIVANAPEYAARLDVARSASPTDGFLDVVFMPHDTALGALGWAARCWGRLCERRAVHARATMLKVETSPDAPWQLDGEHISTPASGVSTITIEPESLPVLIPPLSPHVRR